MGAPGFPRCCPPASRPRIFIKAASQHFAFWRTTEIDPLRNLFASLILVSLLLAGCGGGGGAVITTSSSSSSSGGSSSSSSSSSSGGSSSSSSGSGSTAYNVVNAIVDQGPAELNNAGVAAVDIMYVNVTVCVPGSTTNCQTIDHIQVDTGSAGLRIVSSVLNSSLLNDLQAVTAGGTPVAECLQFVDGYSWGPLVTADVHVGGSDSATSGESAPNIPIQIIGTSTYSVPAACVDTGATPENTVAEFGANGIIGVGLFAQDCGSGCSVAGNGWYYTCSSSSSCTSVGLPTGSQLTNPVAAFAANSSGVADNNGDIIELPMLGATGATTVNGYLIFGIGTESNNALSSSATVITTDDEGYVSASFLGSTFSQSYLDSGSNSIDFVDSNIANCTSSSNAPSFMCPTSTQSLSVTFTGQNSQSALMDFSIANANTLFTDYSNNAAFNDLGAPVGSGGSDTFDMGLPFYFGVNVYTAIQGMVAGSTTGPYFAF
jgi:hypothetical protein